MIKVNLLKDHTVRARKSFAKPTASRMGILLLVLFLLVAGGMGYWTRNINQQIDAGKVKRADLRKTDEELKKLNAEIDTYAKLKSQLEARTQAIDKLQEERSGPVSLLNAVIQSVPPKADLWLTSIDQKSASIKIIGQTLTPEAIPDLMINLAASGFFTSVDLELIERTNDTSKFSLLCTSLNKYQAE
jgi:Tfp pilus assembly protein PilN